MKHKLSKIIGIGFALILVASLMLFAVPAAAGPYDDLVPFPSNAWLEFSPTVGVFGLWFYSPTISQVGPMARAINGDIYAYVANATSGVAGPATPNNPGGNDVFKSIDNGRTWSVSQVPYYYFNTNAGAPGGAVVDMVCSDVSEDVLYLTDGNYVFKSINGAASFALVVADDLEKKLCGACGIVITGGPITCIDLGYDGSGLPITLIGTKYVSGHFREDGDPAIGTVLWISDETFSAAWTDLQVECFGCCPRTVTAEVIATGDGGTTDYDVFVMFPPLKPASITVTDGVETFTDPDGNGVFASDGAGSGTIDYSTGEVDISFAVAVGNGTDVTATYDSCYGCYDVYAVAAAPGFANVPKVYAVVTAPLFAIDFAANSTAVVTVRAGDLGATIDVFDEDAQIGANVTYASDGADTFPDTLLANEEATFTADGSMPASTIFVKVTDETISWRLSAGAGATFCGGTRVISTLTVCSWNQVTELMWDCRWSYTIQHATRIMFPSYYGTQPTLFVGTVAVEGNDWWGEGGDVYRVADTIPPSGCIDLNVQGFTTGCAGLRHANICSLDIDDADGLLAGAWDEYQLQSPTRVYYSADGGWTWAPSLKDPTGTDRAYVLFGSALAGTRGCDCGFSMSCGDNIGRFFNQISLISMDIDAVLDLTHSPDYVLESSMFYALTQDDLTNADRDSGQPCYGAYPEIRSLLRWDGTYWERVHSSRFFLVLTTQANSDFMNFPLYDWVEVSPDFNSTSVVYMANTEFYMARTLDAGCSWAPLTYPCFDRPSISAWIVVDEDSVLAAGAGDFAGYIYRTTNHGAQPWDVFEVKNTVGVDACDGVDFDLSLPRAADSDVLFGDACGQVYISFDLGATWTEIQDVNTGDFNTAAIADTLMTYVVFDPGYAIAGDPGEKVVYAAAGSLIGRCAVDFAAALPFKQDWQYLNPGSGDCVPCTLCTASGIDAAGDTVLYVADGGAEGEVSCYDFSGTIGVRYPDGEGGYDTCDITIAAACATHVFGTFVMNEPVTLVGCNLTCGDDDDVVGTIQVEGLVNGGVATIEIDDYATFPCECTEDDLIECIDSELHVSSLPASGTNCAPGVWRSVNPLALIDEAKGWNYVEWEFLDEGVTTPTILWHPAATEPAGYTAFTVYPDDLWLTFASNVLWVLESAPALDSPEDIWIWDDPLAVPVIQVAPADGALLATTTTATLEWEALDGAEYYEYMLYSYCPSCPDNMVIFGSFTSLLNQTCVVVEGLTPGTTYYWKVRVACDSPKVSKWSDLRTFDTALGAVPYLCSPWCGQDDVTISTAFSWDAVIGASSYDIEIATDEAFTDVVSSGTTTVNAWTAAAPLEYSTVYYWRVRAVKDGVTSAWAVCIFTTAAEPVEPPEAQPPVVVEQTEITPVWIWVIIGIGGALTIAVVILIVTTRRVP
jgi:hypothetical protein